MANGELGNLLVNLAGETPDEMEQRAIEANARFQKLKQQQSQQRPPSLTNYLMGAALQIGRGAHEIATAPQIQASDPYTAKSALSNQLAQGASDVIRGASPFLAGFAPLGAAAPLATLAGLGGGMLAGKGVESLATKAGVQPGVAALAGDVAGLVGGGAAGGLAGRVGPEDLEGLARAYRESPLSSERGAITIRWKPGMKLSEIPEDIAVPKTGPRLTIHDLGAYFNDRIGKSLGQIPADASPKQKLNRILKLAIPEFEDQLSQPDPKLDFYTKDAAQADADILQAYPELAKNPSKLILQKAISAASSPANEPVDEAEIGGRIYGIYRNTGQLPLMQPSGKNWPGQNPKVAMAQLQKYLDYFGGGEKGEEGLADFLVNNHPVRELKKLNPNVGGKADDVVPGSLILGPKVGRYFNDLMGFPQEGSTIDRWEVRGNQRRLGDTLREGKLIDTPLSISDRDVFMELHRILGDRYHLTRNQAQSGSWHYEKGLYTRLGVKSPATGRSEGTLKLLQSMGQSRP